MGQERSEVPSWVKAIIRHLTLIDGTNRVAQHAVGTVLEEVVRAMLEQYEARARGEAVDPAALERLLIWTDYEIDKIRPHRREDSARLDAIRRFLIAAARALSARSERDSIEIVVDADIAFRERVNQLKSND